MTTYSSLASVGATRLRLAELGLSTKKSLGQHFLIDDGVVGKILRLAAVEPGSTVIEIGPGIGTLTEALLHEDLKLTAVEIDSSLIAGLQERFDALTLINADALAPATIKSLRDLAPTALVANLPYAVAATIILEYFQSLPSLTATTVMVQREVGERIAAQPGSKDYGAFTVKLGLLAEAKGQFKVQAQCFYPPPRVDSSVIRLERKASYSNQVETASWLADAAFFQRRKTIKNSICAYFEEHGLSTEQLDRLFAEANIDPACRGETLSTGDYMNLATVQTSFGR